MSLAPLALMAGGCAGGVFSSTVWNPLHLPLPQLDKKPVRIGIGPTGGDAEAARVWWDLGASGPYASMQEELRVRLGKSVQIEPMKPFQIAAHLKSGRLQFALLSLDEYREASKDGPVGEIIAVAEPTDRQGLIVTAADSDIRQISDLKGKRFAFGPHNDAVLHYGALAALEETGVTVNDITKELVPLPGSLQHHISSYEAAKEVIYGVAGIKTPAGVIEKTEYDALPDTGGKFINPIQPSLSKDQFRVLGETPKAEEGRFIASEQADPDMRAKVQSFLLDADKKHKNVVSALGLSRFSAPTSQATGSTKQVSAR
ncbi:MAG TPA: PhnD/SsuA/transferrin family substrate-binding protein [Phycisphaerae bacterium]|jgi:ABC-type phosphate/phosphonate transport system substrate-binding protein